MSHLKELQLLCIQFVLYVKYVLHFHIIIIIIIMSSSLATDLFFVVLLLDQLWSPLLRLQFPDCSTFVIMCDVARIAIICSESIECFPGMASKCFLKPLVTNLVTPIITGIISNFRFHIHCISIHKLLYFSLFLLPFAWRFCLKVLPHPSTCMFYHLSLPLRCGCRHCHHHHHYYYYYYYYYYYKFWSVELCNNW